MPDNPRIEELRRRVERDPSSIAFAQLGEEYRRAGHYAEAIETCRAGLDRHPGYLSARVTLGRALIETGELDAAEQELTRVLEAAAENLAAIRGLADIHHRRHDLPTALAYYRRALALAQNDPDLEQTVADVERAIGSVSTPPRRPEEPSAQGHDELASLLGELESAESVVPDRTVHPLEEPQTPAQDSVMDASGEPGAASHDRGASSDGGPADELQSLLDAIAAHRQRSDS